MKRIIYALLSTLSAAVLVGSYYFSLHDAGAPASTATTISVGSTPSTADTGATPSTGSSTSGALSGSGDSTSSTAVGQATFTDGNYTGTAVQTRYGPVQVAITVSGGRIADVQVPQYPSGGGREQRINSDAVPQLVDETLAAQSAHIDMVSGATYTMSGYLSSLQNALDQARS